MRKSIVEGTKAQLPNIKITGNLFVAHGEFGMNEEEHGGWFGLKLGKIIAKGEQV